MATIRENGFPPPAATPIVKPLTVHVLEEIYPGYESNVMGVYANAELAHSAVALYKAQDRTRAFYITPFIVQS